MPDEGRRRPDAPAHRAARRCPRSRRPSRKSTSTRRWSGSSWARRTTSRRCSPPATALHDAGIRYEVRVMSAHRDPEMVREYCQNARMRGLKVIIAGAGMSAALPGVAAAHTDLPVIGVPILGKSLGGLDALLSAVQMPPGVPVACVAIDGAKNAGRAGRADHQLMSALIPRYTRARDRRGLDASSARWSAGSRSSWRRPRPGPRRGSCPTEAAEACREQGRVHGRGGRRARADHRPRRRRLRRRRRRLGRRARALDPLRADLLRRARHRAGAAAARRPARSCSPAPAPTATR